jgi:hypothetical protein
MLAGALEMLAEALKKIKVGHPRTFAGLSVYPLIGVAGASPGDAAYTVLDDALGKGTARITEVSDSGSVPELAFENEGDRPVLILDGEELVGAKQNRIVNLTILAPAKSKVVIPVSCVEAGRWRSMSREFKGSPQVMYARARAGKAESVSYCMSIDGTHTSDQSKVWDDIGRKQRELKSKSPTSRMTDTFEDRGAELDDYVSNLPRVEGQVGAVFALAGKVNCVELFDSAETLEKMWPKLVRSWALDALSISNRPHDVRPVAEAQALIDEVAAAKPAEHEALGLGKDLRFSGGRLNGGALVHDDRLVHLCVFRDASRDDDRGRRRDERGDGNDWTGWRPGRMTSASRRNR